MDETRRLASFVAQTGYADLPNEVIEKARIYLLDNLAAGFVGSVQPWSLIVASLARDLGGNGGASVSVFNRAWQLDLSRATLVNGVMMGAFEAEHIGHVAHPSATVFPAALAVAERDHCDGSSLIAALMLGYEVVCRIGEAQTRATEAERGFHNPGVNGAFGAAAAVGKLLGLDERSLAWALGIAGSHACGLVEFVWEGSMTKRMHPGRAAQLGLESALLAQKGFSGPTTVLEGRHGYLQAYSPRPQPEQLVAGLGREWLVADLVLKAYPCHITGQAVVHAIQQFKQDRRLDARAIGRVALTVSPHATEERHLDRQPTSLLGAQYSLPYTTAVALIRDLSKPLVFDDETLTDPAIRALAGRIEVRADVQRFGGAGKPAGEVVIELDGVSHTLIAGSFPGSAAQPLDFEGAADKLRRYAGPIVSAQRVERLIELVQGLDRLDDVSRLAELIRA
jgi:2-methylcitrate dehydratase PrpD